MSAAPNGVLIRAVLAWFGTPFLHCVPFFLVSLALLAVDRPGRLG